MRKTFVTLLLIVMLALLAVGTIAARRIPSDWKDGGPNPRATVTQGYFATPTRYAECIPDCPWKP